MSIEIKTIENDSFSMDYFTFGEGEKTMVILPGLSIKPVSESASMVEDGYGIMKKDFTVYVFDRRKDAPKDYSVYDMAEDTAAAFKSLDLKDIYLFGASQGGMISMFIAAKHPELVKKMVLGSTSARVAKGAEMLNRWISLAEERKGEDLYDEFGKAIYPPEVYEQFKGALRLVGSSIKEHEFDNFITMARAADGFDATGSLKDVKCPVFVIDAVPDGVLGNYAAKEIKEILGDRSDFRQFTYEGYGHAAFDTAPDYKEKMLEFFLG